MDEVENRIAAPQSDVLWNRALLTALATVLLGSMAEAVLHTGWLSLVATGAGLIMIVSNAFTTHAWTYRDCCADARDALANLDAERQRHPDGKLPPDRAWVERHLRDEASRSLAAARRQASQLSLVGMVLIGFAVAIASLGAAVYNGDPWFGTYWYPTDTEWVHAIVAPMALGGMLGISGILVATRMRDRIGTVESQIGVPVVESRPEGRSTGHSETGGEA